MQANPVFKLEVKDLSVAFQTKKELLYAANAVSFAVPDGGSVGLWGHSGCGKSTVMKALLGLPLDGPGWVSGDARYCGKRVSPRVDKYVRLEAEGKVFKNGMAFYREHQRLLKPYLASHWRSLFQEPIYSFESDAPIGIQVLSFLDYLAGRDSLGIDKEDLFDEFAAILSSLNLDLGYVRHKRNLELSGGECQRIQLALGVVGKPQLLLADEPTTAMDHDTRGLANALLLEKMRSHKMSLLVSSHNREELLALVDTVVVLCRGMVVEQLPRYCISGSPRKSLHPYTRRLWYMLGDQEERPLSHPYGDARREPDSCPFVEECQYAARDPKLKEKCSREKPPFFSEEEGHLVSCWLHASAAEKEP